MQSRQPELFAALSMTWGLATVAFVLRLVARRMTKLALWWDDYLVFGAYVFGSGWNAVIIKWARDGFGLHLADNGLPMDKALLDARRDLYFDELFYAFSLAFSKLAILALYWRLFSRSGIKIPIIVLAACSVIWLILRTFLAIFHCVPVQAFWDKSIENPICRIDDAKFFVGTVVTHALIDVAIMILPVLQVRKLQLSPVRKMGVMALFMFGIFVCAASVAVIANSFQYDSKTLEMSWEIASIFIWATVEVNLAVVSACLPVLRPIVTAIGRWVHPPSPRKPNYYFPHRPPMRRNLSSRLSDFLKLGISASGDVPKGSRGGEEAGLAYRANEEDGRIMDGSAGPQVIITGNMCSSTSEKGEAPLAVPPGIVVRSEIGVAISARVDSPD